MIGNGGLLYRLRQRPDIPGQIGLATLNGVDRLDGLPLQPATMATCRDQISHRSAGIIAGNRTSKVIKLSPTLQRGYTERS